VQLEIIRGHILPVVDRLAKDGNIWAAIAAIRKQNPARIVMTVPASPPGKCAYFETVVHEVVRLTTTKPVSVVGFRYTAFFQVLEVVAKP
jgi:putative phosphoribosyl transferase